MVLTRGCREVRLGNRVSVLQNKRSSGEQLCNSVNIINTSELYTEEWLRWYVLCYVYFTTIKYKKKKWHHVALLLKV